MCVKGYFRQDGHDDSRDVARHHPKSKAGYKNRKSRQERV